MFRLLSGCAVLLAVCLSADAQAGRPRAGAAGLSAATAERGEGGGPRFGFPHARRPFVAGEAADASPVASASNDGEGDGWKVVAHAEPGKGASNDFKHPRFGRPLVSPPRGDAGDDGDAPPAPDVRKEGFQWKAALEQSLLLLSIQHGYAMTQPKTRRELRGPFLRDYFESLGNLHGWADGGRFFTNYIAHPLQGAATGFIQVQNDPRGMRQQFGGSGAYWRSRLKALAWSAANSTQFELGPISQASIGNVGKARKLTYVDIVMTPVGGTALLVGEDALDRFVVRRIEAGSDNFYLRVAARMLLNPARSCANLLRFKKPWHRDTR